MSRPIKISDELYERLKGQAEADGLTLQDALVELITTPHEGLNVLQRELDASRRALASQGKSQHTQQAALEKLRSELASLRDDTVQFTTFSISGWFNCCYDNGASRQSRKLCLWWI